MLRRWSKTRRSPMTTAGALKLTTPGERDIVMTRVFDAPCQLVFDAHTKPELVKRWLLGPPGWSMPVCEIDLRVGGKYRFVWRHDRNGTEMGMGGVYREIKAPERIVGALFVVATAYRIVYSALGGYITARLAPHAPARHALILGLIGLVPGIAGVIANIAKPELGPLWYSVAVGVTGPPCAWLGGVLYPSKQS